LTLVIPDAKFNDWIGYIVFVALPDESGADGLVTYALGPIGDAEGASYVAMVAQLQNPDAFVRWSPLRRPEQAERPVIAVIKGD
jgi:hypothetical protein